MRKYGEFQPSHLEYGGMAGINTSTPRRRLRRNWATCFGIRPTFEYSHPSQGRANLMSFSMDMTMTLITPSLGPATQVAKGIAGTAHPAWNASSILATSNDEGNGDTDDSGRLSC